MSFKPDFDNKNHNDYFQTVINADLTNQQRWQCYSLRFRDRQNTILPTGYAEISPPTEKDYKEVNARIVYNYVENKIYYSPYHYRPYYCTDKLYSEEGFEGFEFQKCFLSEDMKCPNDEICQNPYFNVIEED